MFLNMTFSTCLYIQVSSTKIINRFFPPHTIDGLAKKKIFRYFCL